MLESTTGADALDHFIKKQFPAHLSAEHRSDAGILTRDV